MSYPTTTTKLFIILGNPLGHSISPPMHNRVFEELGLDYCYMPVEVSPENLATVFAGLTRMNVGGFNVTIPHKMAIMDHLDAIDPLAKRIGAVNTICISEGKTKGYNTDGEGFIRSLEENGNIKVKDKKVFILGCGGAVRAISMTLASHGSQKIFICNRTLQKAETLVSEINNKICACAEVIEQQKELQAEAIKECDILINGTSIGMHPKTDQLPLDESFIHQKLVVADIVYNPLMTKLLKTAQERGCTIVNGLGMLIYQGAAAFKLWTGREPLIAEMSEVVHSLMAKRQ